MTYAEVVARLSPSEKKRLDAALHLALNMLLEDKPPVQIASNNRPQEAKVPAATESVKPIGERPVQLSLLGNDDLVASGSDGSGRASSSTRHPVDWIGT